MHRDAAFICKVYNLSERGEQYLSIRKFTVPGLPHLLISDTLPGRRMETVHTWKKKSFL